MTEQKLNLLTDYFQDNGIEGLDPQKVLENMSDDEIRAMVSGNDEYVVKRSGNIEKYKKDKVARSIKNSADESDIQLNSSDVDIIIKDITDRLFYGDDKKLTPTVEVRDMVIEILKKDGYSKVSEAYENYAKNQN
ncbi:ATP cone domain-containing protein [uncultured Anaerococcus sp.]|uniref:ATP cone domain-containing protein n=1 Tax=uncultured Anaerococcus sp. TaxID=293428 RepID=UPI002605E573|nr:ATP cone domain-containing protein [uncultured Anaerococcus sp.]